MTRNQLKILLVHKNDNIFLLEMLGDFVDFKYESKGIYFFIHLMYTLFVLLNN